MVAWSSVILGATLGACPLPYDSPPVSASVAPVAVAAGVTVLPAPGTLFTTPADGRLRGPDFAATVTGVAWPDRALLDGKSQVPTPGHRFVDFNLTVSEDASAITPAGNDPAVTATVQWGTSSFALPLTQINTEIANGAAASSWPSGSAQYVGVVPNTAHDVNLVLSQGSFSQSFNLWTLQRNAPAPTVLYRDASRPTLADSTPASTTLSLSNPSDGFSGTAQVSLQSVSLSDFGPSGPGNAQSSPDEAMLNVVLDGEFPDNPNDPTGSGHYLGAQTPVPGSILTFTVPGHAPVAATLSDSGDTNGQGNNDDGLFDATYSFVVPATVTSGTLTIGPGSFDGTEFTLFTADNGNTNLDMTAPATLPMGFPAVPAVVTQKRPPWIGAPPPPTALAASPSALTAPATGAGGGFPIWLAVLLLIVVAGTVVVFQRRNRIRGLRWSFPWSGDRRSPAASTTAPAETAPDPIDAVVVPVGPGGPIDGPSAAPAGTAAAETKIPAPSFHSDLVVKVLGPVEVDGWHQVPDRRVIEELFSYLVFNDRHPQNADQIQMALRPTDGARPDIARKTFHSYLSGLRQCIGADHLPEATAGAGYRVIGVDSDWALFERLSDQADRTDGPESIELRRQALSLVRGAPFQGVPRGQYDWALDGHLYTDMASTIVTCALRAANDLFALDRYKDVEEVVQAGQLVAPKDPHLQRFRDLAIDARNEGLIHPGRFPGDSEPTDPDDTEETA
jgi:hypothetical protein